MSKIKYTNYQIGGEVIKDNEVYCLTDNKILNNLILSQTVLHRNQQTRGHRHEGQEEIYFFVRGTGLMIVGDEDTEPFSITSGDIILIPDGQFHRVINNGDMDLIFNCVFNGQRNH